MHVACLFAKLQPNYILSYVTDTTMLRSKEIYLHLHHLSTMFYFKLSHNIKRQTSVCSHTLVSVGLMFRGKDTYMHIEQFGAYFVNNIIELCQRQIGACAHRTSFHLTKSLNILYYLGVKNCI